MKTANVSTTKNRLSSILAEVKRGETYLVLDRNVPVARIEPLQDVSEKLGSLVSTAKVVLPRTKLDVSTFLQTDRYTLPNGASAVSALLSDRDEET